MASIDKRERGGTVTWLARWRDDTGRQRKRSFSRKIDAQRFVTQLEADLLRGQYVDPFDTTTVLEYAREKNIAMLVNRPLNAMVAPNRMLRLADLPLEDPPIDIDQYLSKVGALEQEYRTSLAPNIPPSETGTTSDAYFNWSAELHRIRQQIQGLEHWEHLERQMIAPHINQVLQLLTHQLSGDVAEQWERWRQRYIPELLTLLRGFRREAWRLHAESRLSFARWRKLMSTPA